MIKLKNILVTALTSLSLCVSAQDTISLFNGKTLNNWKPAGKENRFTVENSLINISDKAGILYYSGKNNQFRDFQLQCKVLTTENSIANILFATQYQPEGKQAAGYAIHLKNTYDGIASGEKLRLTGSIDRIRNVYFPYVRNNEWFDLKISVIANVISVWINGAKVSEYVEPQKPWRPDDLKTRILAPGTIALQGIQGTVKIKQLKLITFKNTGNVPQYADWEYDKAVTQLHAENFPFIDFHVHIKGGLTLEDVLKNSVKIGMNYGVAANCGLKFPVTNDQQLNAYLNSIRNAPIFKGMQAEGREWMTLFSPDTAGRFDYIFTDAMTWTNHNGKRLRLWIKEETEVGDPNTFMDELTSKIEQITTEPIDIYVNPTFLPEEIAARYDALWTEERMNRVINALAKNKVALEINARYKIPSIAFLKKAKAAGVKFTFGTNNTGPNDLSYDYCFKVLKELELTPNDMWMPRKPGERKIQKR